MSHIDDIRNRLQSTDFNSRIQAAAELGEQGSEADAPILLRMTWEDKISNVQQFAIQAYVEIMGDRAYNDLKKIIEEHPDEYVVQYAISSLVKVDKKLVIDDILRLIASDNPTYRTTSLRSAIMMGMNDIAEQVFHQLKQETYSLAIRNCIEALALWKYSKAEKLIRVKMQEIDDLEIKTISLFALACYGNKNARKELEEGEIDNYVRVTINNTRYSGRDGLLLALENI